MRNSRFFGNKRLAASTAFGSALLSCAVTVAVIMLLGFFVARIDATDMILSAMSTFALCVGALSGGYVSGKKHRRNGLLMGVLCGVFVFMIIILVSRFFAKATQSISLPSKLILTLICSGLGGILGVNAKNGKL